jgi:hypothetical protein
MTGLLKHRIQTLVLKEYATYPSQMKDSKDMIKEWRREQRCKLVVFGSRADPADVFADSLPDTGFDGQKEQGR